MSEDRLSDLLNRSDEDWDRLEDALATVAGFRAGHTLTQADIDAMELARREQESDEESATEAYHRGLADGRREAGGTDMAAALEKLDAYSSRVAVERALGKFARQWGIRQGAAHCREVMARFVEQGGDPVIANSIRHNWNSSWGPDPGPGVTLEPEDEDEVVSAEQPA